MHRAMSIDVDIDIYRCIEHGLAEVLRDRQRLADRTGPEARQTVGAVGTNWNTSGREVRVYRVLPPRSHWDDVRAPMECRPLPWSEVGRTGRVRLHSDNLPTPQRPHFPTAIAEASRIDSEATTASERPFLPPCLWGRARSDARALPGDA
jgi:hypothetical protein